MIDQGSGPPLVLIPGVQGRWEYARPTVKALSASFRVLTSSLCGEPGAGAFDLRHGLDADVHQILAALDERRIERAIICGISFGGLVGIRFAALHPSRTAALVAVSTPGPGWRLSERHQAFVDRPRLFGPLFVAQWPGRFGKELATSLPSVSDRAAYVLRLAGTAVRAPVSFARMAARAQLIPRLDLADDCRHIAAPTLLVTGEEGLDHVVPVGASSQYASMIRSARVAVMKQTGHLGTVTRPLQFAALVRDFVKDAQHAAA